MELKYIWTKEYKNLKNIDFNFKHSIDEQFSFDQGVLTVKPLDSGIPKNFFGFNVRGVTAVVGRNGSGKTNLTELIYYSLSHVENGGLSTYLKINGLVVLGDYIFIQESIKIINEKEIKAKGYEIFRFENAPLDKSQLELHWSTMERNKYIYYNPVFDFRILPLGTYRGNLQNISTSYLAWKDLNHSKLFNRKNVDLLVSHERLEKLREADCVLNYSEIEEFLNPLPTELLISVEVFTENGRVDIPYFSKDDIKDDPKKKILNQQYDQLRTLKDYYRRGVNLQKYRVVEDGRVDKFRVPLEIKKEFFIGLFWVNFFSIYLKVKVFNFPENFYKKFIYDENWEIEDIKLTNQLSKLKENLTKIVDTCVWRDFPLAVKDSTYSLEEIENSYYDLFRHTNFSTEQGSNKKLFKTLIKSVNDILDNNLPFHYQFFDKYSSGQQKLLNFYSRFYWASKMITVDEKGMYGVKGERVVIIIDEGEVSLHPEWQRNYFDNSIQFLSKLFKDKELQLIYITHSPFVLSDIPKDNVIFLDKGKNGNAIKANLKHEKTFGANIYSLLADSFFMENGTIGEFAKKKIEWVVEVLENSNSILSSENLKKVNYIINSVGEPLIKQQLEIMRNNFINKDKLSSLEKQVQELKDELSKRDDNN